MRQPVSEDEIHDHVKFQKYTSELVEKVIGTVHLSKIVKELRNECDILKYYQFFFILHVPKMKSNHSTPAANAAVLQQT